jgi:hypothetical protein
MAAGLLVGPCGRIPFGGDPSVPGSLLRTDVHLPAGQVEHRLGFPPALAGLGVHGLPQCLGGGGEASGGAGEVALAQGRSGLQVRPRGQGAGRRRAERRLTSPGGGGGEKVCGAGPQRGGVTVEVRHRGGGEPSCRLVASPVRWRPRRRRRPARLELLGETQDLLKFPLRIPSAILKVGQYTFRCPKFAGHIWVAQLSLPVLSARFHQPHHLGPHDGSFP